MFSLPLFSKLKESNPAALEKVVPVHGDLLQDQLAIADKDRKLLEDNVNMVFHVAASVQFKATFRELMQHNYFGTRKVMDLAKGIKDLESFVYFSTAYSNIARKYLDEKPIAALASQEDIDYCLRTDTVDRLRKISSAPVYTFSKNFTEVLVEQERGDLPTIMIRPAAVTACLRDPLPGWMDTWIAHPSFFVEHSRGLVSAAVGHRDVVADIIPADYVANLAIVAAARGRRTKEMLIYNSCTGTMNPLTWMEGCDLFRQYALQEGKWDLPPRKLVQSSSYLVVHLLTIIRDRIPALLGDLWLRLKGEQPKYLKLQKRALFMRDNVDVLMETSVFLKCTQAFLLAQTLDDHDRERFPFDPNTINWSEYMPTLYRSIYKYMIEKKK
ncbi:fatty acyl-CoA reductase 1-like isoform X2 [Aricia agestis]|uniref:fatty acyl-CoA reductase 1-like isoform X2 n=2 Tax=Aricia agestis TaxID=91739 RepID=UPI001C206D7C|nr:fatty acyl-CoA reductase 1-like isoform X2 [Aricia agestis]